MSDGEQLKETIRAIASELGFARMGVASADAVEGEQEFCAWLEAGYQGEMDYLSRNVTKRFHPAGLVPGGRSVLSLVMSYAPDTNPGEGSAAEIACDRALVARYARGRDYPDSHHAAAAGQPAQEPRRAADRAEPTPGRNRRRQGQEGK